MAHVVLTSAVVSRAQRPPLSRSDQASAFFSMMRMNVRRTFGVWVVLATAGFVILFISQTAVTEVVLWSDYSYYVGRAFVIIGPIFAIWSASLAQRDMKPTRLELLATTANPCGQRELRPAIVGVLMSLVCYGIVAGVVLGFAATRATWGAPDLWLVTFGAVITVLIALIGWLMGTLAPGRMTPLVAGLTTLFYTTISYTWGPDHNDLLVLQPYRYVANSGWSDMQLFYEDMPKYPNSPHPASGILLALGGMAIVGALYLFKRHARGALIALALAAVLVVPGWIVAADREAMDWNGTPIRNPDMVCGGDVVEVCLHQAYEVQLDEAITFSNAFYAPMAGLPGIPELVTQQPFGKNPPGGTVRLNAGWTATDVETVLSGAMGQALFPSPIWLNSEGYDSECDHTPAQAAIVQWLVRQAGGRGYTAFEIVGLEHPIAGPNDPPSEQAMQAYWQELEDIQAEINAAAERFAALPQDEQRAWLSANWDALRAGELTLEDLP